MASSERKRRTKRLAAKGWHWEPSLNAYVLYDLWASPRFVIEYRHQAAKWAAGGSGAVWGSVSDVVLFDDPEAAAVWLEVEYATKLAEIRKATADFQEYCLADAAAPGA